jgi:hypothetical protein
MSWFEKLKGKRLNDIELPNESGADPRLKGKSVRERVDKIPESLKTLRDITRKKDK